MIAFLSASFLGCAQTPPGRVELKSDTGDTVTAECGDCDGYLPSEGDCDDSDPTVHPGVVEACDGIDNDCDGTVDEDAAPTVYADADGDTYGDPAASWEACDATGGVLRAGDCDDTDATVHPDAVEACDGVDQDCDGEVDEGFTVATWYTDADGDGVGDASSGVEACAQPDSAVADAGDCDDANAATVYCASCQEVLDRGVGTTDGVYTLDPCGGAPSDYWCDQTSDGGGWTVAGWQAANATTTLGLSVRNAPGDADFSVDLACVPYDEIAVFDQTHGGWEAQSYPGSTWSETAINLAIGDPGLAFAQGTYGPAGIVMGCVDYAYSGAIVLAYACDTDWQGGARGHIADYAGEFCGDRLDSTWAWTDGATCSWRGEPYTWGFAIRGYAESTGNGGIGDG